jgi:hypothetical protein
MPTRAEVLNVLSKMPPMFTIRQVADGLGLSVDTVGRAIVSVLTTIPNVKPAGIGAHVPPDGAWMFI